MGRCSDRPDEATTVLYLGGQGFQLVHAEQLFAAFAELNVDVVAFDYRGYGKSTGKPSVPKLKADALAIYDHVSSLGPTTNRLILHGHSMGSFLATYVATQREVGAVVLESPATDVAHWRATVLPWWLRWLIDFESPATLEGESNLARVAEMDVPLLLLVGAEDPITPPSLARALHERSQSPWKELVEVPSAGHNDLPGRIEFIESYGSLLSAMVEL